jgi:hypothetical protein
VDWIKGPEDIRVVGVDSGIERARVGEHWLGNFFSPVIGHDGRVDSGGGDFVWCSA